MLISVIPVAELLAWSPLHYPLVDLNLGSSSGALSSLYHLTPASLLTSGPWTSPGSGLYFQSGLSLALLSRLPALERRQEGVLRPGDHCVPCTEFKMLHTWVNLQLPVGQTRPRIVRQSLAVSEWGWKPVGS